jgi:glycerophosphoryl diester phosphodiesterase
MRFLFLVVGSVLVVFMILMTFRFWGLGQTYATYPVGFFQQQEPLQISYYGSPEASRRAIWWIDVNFKDDQLWADTQTPLEEVFKKNPDKYFVLNILSNVHNIHIKVADLVTHHKLAKKILIQSDFKNILSSIRDLLPTAAFGSSIADLTKIKVYQSLYILPAVTFLGDALVMPLNRERIKMLDQEIVDEFHRRGKKIIVAPINDAAEINEIKQFGVDGWIVPTIL